MALSRKAEPRAGLKPAHAPPDAPELQAAAQRCRKLLNRRALVAAAASAVPLPGLDWAVDAALLSRLIPAINAEFGLSAEQIERLPHHQRDQVQQAITAVGSMLVGRMLTKDLLLALARRFGLRLTSQQAVKYVPVAGQAVSALIGYLAIRYLGNAHIEDCLRVRRIAGSLGWNPTPHNEGPVYGRVVPGI